MRPQFGTRDHLPRFEFTHEIGIALACDARQPDHLAALRESMGSRRDGGAS